MTFKRGLVALSLSEADRGLLRYAALLARLGCEEFQFVHVVPPGPGRSAGQPGSELLDLLQREVQEHFHRHAPQVAAAGHVLEGVRLDSLLQFAAKENADVILLGHRKSRSGRRSLARRLAMFAPCSVWMVPEDAAAALDAIMVPIDFSEHSADALAVATALAARAGLTECHTMHVYFDRSTIQYEEHVNELIGQEEQAFAKFLAQVPCHGVRVTPIFEDSSHPAEAILRAADAVGASLLVMNTRGRSRAAAILLGSITAEVISQTQLPILVVKHFGAKMNLFQALLDHRTWSSEIPKSN